MKKLIFGKKTYNFPDILPSQVSLSVLHICDDFVGLLAHCFHVQFGLVAVTFTDVFVQTTSGVVNKATRNKHAGPLPVTQSHQRLENSQHCSFDNHAHAGRHVCLGVPVTFIPCRNPYH